MPHWRQLTTRSRSTDRYGYSNEYPVERFWRNSRGAVIYEGTREIHTILQADYALGYRQDKPLRCPQPPAQGFETEDRLAALSR